MSNKLTEAMTLLAAKARSEPSWGPYAEWCGARANSLHERAATIAVQFAEAARHWPFAERKQFTLWVVQSTGLAMEQCGNSQFKSRFSTGGPGLFAPRIVVDAVVQPTLVEWRDAEPGNPEPYFWLGLYDDGGWASLQNALRLDPSHSSTRAALAMCSVIAIEYDQHELPSGYLGDPGDDLIALTKAEALVAGAADPAVDDSMGRKIAILRTDAEDWIRLREQLERLDWDARMSLWHARPKPSLFQNS
jgi:hypothetical protein